MLAPAAVTAGTSATTSTTEADVVHGCCRLELHLGARRRGALVQQHVWQRVPRSEPLAVRQQREHQGLRLQQLSTFCGLPGALPVDGIAAAPTAAAAPIASATDLY